MKITIGDTLIAETTDRPLLFTPRFDFRDLQLIVAGYEDPAGREGQLPDTFGSMQWLWSQDEHFRFDRGSRELCSLTFFVPPQYVSVPRGHAVHDKPRTQACGLRADAAREFAMPQTTVFNCDPGATELICLRDIGVLDRELDARLGIAPDVALLVQEGAVVGWSLGDPVRYLTDGFADPRPTPPDPAIRLRLAECLELVSSPLVDLVMDEDADAWHRLRATEHALREQQDDRHRAEILRGVISRLIEDYEA
ncbi:hypothetical protein OG978_43395 (plasmid) [Streptomyces sp. NBC_01591]|uniref:hypothetical protein n=1 Tax=Streptomyces sp. NBC_01591 TaxID=2975888 RepID=UPI002DD9CB35|nr:hypothetical protein [Streptomyces sp. NBC_01591]WSD74016.1 hypothetical protein OG978_43395 [Streptomyces sp. NBC_01591]